MNVDLMAHRVSPYDRARRAHERQRCEQTLTCPGCGTANRPGARVIDLDDHDDAWCDRCGHVFQVRVP